MNIIETLPKNILISGYPSDEWLLFLMNYKPDESLPIIKFVEEILPEGWFMSDWGFVLGKKYRGIRKLQLHTGGWSGNEDTISAMLTNIYFTHFQMRYVQWRTGGHYFFEIKY